MATSSSPLQPHHYPYLLPQQNTLSAVPNMNHIALDSSSIITDTLLLNPNIVGATPKKRRLINQPAVYSSPTSSHSTEKRGESRGVVKKNKTKKVKEERKGEDGGTSYIHVRARRGQATDSHSLAERVRREKISERMKLLQSLVPGCHKVTGKALMLDEIINYVQSLQSQVELLSMKLASVNPTFYDFGMDIESFMVQPDQDFVNLPSLQSNNFNTPENFAHFQQALIPPIFPQGNSETVWELEEERQRIVINQTGTGSNCSLF